jgi:6-phosphogluconolactonase
VSAQWKSYPAAAEAAAACATHILSLLEMGLAGDDDVTFAISGGSTPKLMFAELVRARFDWRRVQLFWVDERAVPPEHADSNYRMADEHLIRPAHIPQRNVHRIRAEFQPAQAARHYEREIREVFRLEPGEMPHFDVIHLGVGSDAHTASLFPGEPLIEDRARIVASVHVPKLSAVRITLLPGVLLAARHTAVLVSGQDKAEAMREIIHGSYAPLNVPAQIVARQSRRATWFLDEPAASLLSRE